MRSVLTNLVILISFCCYLPLSFANQDDTTPVFTFDTIEVTAEAIDVTGTGNRVGLDPIDSPESSTVIDDEIMDDQQITHVDDILKNDASVSNEGSFGARSNFRIRGFSLNQSGNYLRNGLLFFFLESPAIEIIDRVEVLKGPASFLYGPGSPGGMINFITKKPQAEEFNNGGVQVGSWDYYRAFADLNQSSEQVDYRLNVAVQDSNSFRDVYHQDRQLFDFSANSELFGNTDTWFNVNFQNTNQPQDTGLVAIGDHVADLPSNTYLNQDWSNTEQTTANSFLDSYTDLSDNWTLHTGLIYQYVHRDRILTNLVMTDSDSGDFKYNIYQRLDTWNYYNALVETIGEETLVGFDQKLLFGTTYSLMDHEAKETQAIVTQVYNIYDPPTLAEPDLGDFLDPTTTLTHNFGFYAQDVVQLLQQWEMILGARFDAYQTDSATLTESSVQHTSPHLALLYKPLYFWSNYVSYSEGFEFNAPVSDRNAVNFGEALEPTLSEQIELGSKMELFDSHLLLSAALFDILRHNQPITEETGGDDPSEVIVVQRGEQHHQGLELAAQGKVYQNWTILGTLMWLDAEFSEDNEPDVAGNQPAAVPKLAATLWGEYRFHTGELKNFAINSGVFYEGERYGDDQNTFILDPYARIDAGVGYYFPIREEQKELAIRLNVENISDVAYYYGYRRTNVTVGSPRSVWLTVALQ
ncbi:MAG: TonB-dependent siderophore receptor [Legionellales bacterium]|jgi:iron complex outermembrane receptor protein